MSAQSIIYDKIIADLKDDKTFDAVTTKRLFYYLETIKDITGSGGAFTYGNGVPSGGSAGDYYIQTDATSIWFNAAGTWTVILSPSPIESSWTNTLARIGSIVPNQAYKVNNDDLNLPAGVDYILIWGLDANAYNPNGQAYLTGLGIFPCDYDLVGNQISVVIDTILRVTQTGTNDPVVDVTKHGINGLTFGSGRSDMGIYGIIPSFPLSTQSSGLFNEVHIHMTGTTPNLGDLAQPISFTTGYYDELNDTCRIVSQSLDLVTGLTPTDGIYNDTPIYLTCILSN